MTDHGHDHPAHGPTHDHSHDHGHDHSHGGFGHAHGVTDTRRLAWAFAVIVVFMGVEIAGGVISGSLALLADAGHMASDAIALAASFLALRIGRRPADGRLSYGYRRTEVLAAFVNACTLFGIAIWVIIEAIRRFAAPVQVLGPTMMIVAIAGLVANLIALAILSGGSKGNLNMRSAWLHVMGDLLGSVAAIVAAVIIMLTGFTAADPILSVLVAVLILKGAFDILRGSARILLEAAPEGLDLDEMRRDLLDNTPGVAEVHHLHAWSLSSEQRLVTLHAVAAEGADPFHLPGAISARLAARFQINHATVQVERVPCSVAVCDPSNRPSSAA